MVSRPSSLASAFRSPRITCNGLGTTDYRQLFDDPMTRLLGGENHHFALGSHSFTLGADLRTVFQSQRGTMRRSRGLMGFRVKGSPVSITRSAATTAIKRNSSIRIRRQSWQSKAILRK